MESLFFLSLWLIVLASDTRKQVGHKQQTGMNVALKSKMKRVVKATAPHAFVIIKRRSAFYEK